MSPVFEEWMQPALDSLAAYQSGGSVVLVKLDRQTLYLIENGLIQAEYPVSTSRYGAGGEDGSLRTPLGVHRIAARIGESCPAGEILKAREPTGQMADIITEARHGKADVITSRILWLEGLEEGRNRGPGVDSCRRYIYIHGTAEEGLIGRPASIGCIRMTNTDVINLFGRIREGTPVNIIE